MSNVIKWPKGSGGKQEESKKRDFFFDCNRFFKEEGYGFVDDEDDVIRVQLPWPPTQNSNWRMLNGRTLLSRKSRDYKSDVIKRSYVWPKRCLEGRLELTIIAYPPDKRKRDLDNLLKVPIDAMKAAGLFIDDSQIDKIIIERGSVIKNGLLAVEIIEIDV